MLTEQESMFAVSDDFICVCSWFEKADNEKLLLKNWQQQFKVKTSQFHYNDFLKYVLILLQSFLISVIIEIMLLTH